MKFLDYTGAVKFTTLLSTQKAKDNIMRALNTAENYNSESILEKSHLCGSIEQDRVMLYRVRLLSGNYFYRPIFYRKFIEQEGKLMLEGVFSMSPFIKLVLAVSGGAFVLLEIIVCCRGDHLGVAFTSKNILSAFAVSNPKCNRAA